MHEPLAETLARYESSDEGEHRLLSSLLTSAPEVVNAGAVVVHPEGNRVCLVRAKGAWGLPQGRLGSGGRESPEMSALRWVREQLGASVRFHGTAPNPLDIGGHPGAMFIRFLLVAEKPSEVAEPARWLLWDDALKVASDGDRRAILKAREHCAHSMDGCLQCGALVDDLTLMPGAPLLCAPCAEAVHARAQAKRLYPPLFIALIGLMWAPLAALLARANWGELGHPRRARWALALAGASAAALTFALFLLAAASSSAQALLAIRVAVFFQLLTAGLAVSWQWLPYHAHRLEGGKVPPLWPPVVAGGLGATWLVMGIRLLGPH